MVLPQLRLHQHSTQLIFQIFLRTEYHYILYHVLDTHGLLLHSLANF